MILSAIGGAAQLGNDGQGNECIDGLLSGDGHVDAYDVISGEWAITRSSRTNLCPKTPDRGLPLSSGDLACTECVQGSLESGFALGAEADGSLYPDVSGSQLWILGKSKASSSMSLINERLYTLNPESKTVVANRDLGEFPYSSANIRLVQGWDDHAYQVNLNRGICRLQRSGSCQEILPPDQNIRINAQGRFDNGPATVTIGLQEEGDAVYGRPIWDVQVTRDHVYAVPVVVQPDNGDSYLAAAKFSHTPGNQLHLKALYSDDDPDYYHELSYENPGLTCLREIALDETGNVYVLNSQGLNSSEVLWKYHTDGTLIDRIELTNPKNSLDPNIPNPTGLCIGGGVLYLACGKNTHNEPNSRVHLLSTEPLGYQKAITIQGMMHITDMTLDRDGSLWIVGSRIDHDRLDDTISWTDVDYSFHEPVIACITKDEFASGHTLFTSQPIEGDSGQLGLPLSILWSSR